MTLIPHEQSVQRTRALLARQLSHGHLYRAWELELAHVLGLEVPDEPIEQLMELWDAMTTGTPYPLGIGPWGPHPVWYEQSHGVGHVRSYVRLVTNSDRVVRGGAALVGWLSGLFAPDGSCRAQESFEAIFRGQYPELAAKRDADTRAAWKHTLGERAPADPHWVHSDLEDAWSAIDALHALDARPPDVDSTVRWLRSLQRSDGAFRAPLELHESGEPYADPVHDTMWAVRALVLLGATPADSDAAVAWLVKEELPPAIEPQWACLEALGALRAIKPMARAPLERWDQLSFSEDEQADLVDFEAYAAVRGHRWLVGAL